MLQIALRENPTAHFVHGDMRRFNVPSKFDAILVGGRSFTYMTSNEDVLGALRSIRQALRPKGVLVFDNFDAEAIFKDLARPLRDHVRMRNKTISRVSKRTANLKTGWTWNWDAKYVVKDGRRTRTFRDRSVLRAFTRDELALFLVLTGFMPIRLQRQQSVILGVART
jgi:SAM-dependent methyltransferase